MTQPERYMQETGREHYVLPHTGVYSPYYVKWLETGKEKAEHERDDAIKMAEYFASEWTEMYHTHNDGYCRCQWCETETEKHDEECPVGKAKQFLDKHKESAK